MFKEELAFTFESFENEDSFNCAFQAIDTQWIEDALFATEKASIRRRRLPAQQAFWLIIMMGLMRNMSIKKVCSTLDLALQSKQHNDFSPVAPSVLTDCRKRLGESPLAYLFKTSSMAWLETALSQKNKICLHVLSTDGTTFRSQGTPENREAFGFISTKHIVYPQLRMVGLMSTHSRMMISAAFDSCNVGETTLAKRLLSDIPNDSLTLFDRCYFSADLLLSWEANGSNTHWLMPVKSRQRYEVITRYSDNDLLIEMPVSYQARAKNPALPTTWQARMICYKKPKGDIKGFITSLIDHKKYSMTDLLSTYWQRWEIEEGFGEIKCNQLQGEITLRSRLPEGVCQELWGVLLGYNLIGLEMVSIAEEAEVLPTRISFTAAISIIDSQVRGYALSPDGTLPKKLIQMRQNVKPFILPDKRKH
jgi:hypothetical protein